MQFNKETKKHIEELCLLENKSIDELVSEIINSYDSPKSFKLSFYYIKNNLEYDIKVSDKKIHIYSPTLSDLFRVVDFSTIFKEEFKEYSPNLSLFEGSISFKKPKKSNQDIIKEIDDFITSSKFISFCIKNRYLYYHLPQILYALDLKRASIEENIENISNFLSYEFINNSKDTKELIETITNVSPDSILSYYLNYFYKWLTYYNINHVFEGDISRNELIAKLNDEEYSCLISHFIISSNEYIDFDDPELTYNILKTKEPDEVLHWIW